MKVMLNTNTYYQNKKSLTVNNQITNPYQANKNVSRPAFKGLYSGFTDQLAKLFGFLAKKPQMQNFVDWIAKKDVISTLAATTGILISGFYIYNTSKSKKIEEEQKKPLMINMALVSAMSTIAGLFIDNKAKAKVQQFTDYFLQKNQNKLNEKTLELCKKGIGPASSLLIFTAIYRYIAPVVATPMANKISSMLGYDTKPKQKV